MPHIWTLKSSLNLMLTGSNTAMVVSDSVPMAGRTKALLKTYNLIIAYQFNVSIWFSKHYLELRGLEPGVDY